MPEFQEAAISAKRYCLFIKDTRDRIVIRKPSEHVLGTYLSPEDPVDEDQPEDDEDEPEKDPDEGWIADTWRGLVQRALARPAHRLPGWMDRPAIHRESFTSPAALRPFIGKFLTHPYQDQLKPFNFALRAQIAAAGEAIGIEPGRSRLLAPFERDPRKWLGLDWRDEYKRNPDPDHYGRAGPPQHEHGPKHARRGDRLHRAPGNEEPRG